MVGPECAIPLPTAIENLTAIPNAVKEWHSRRDRINLGRTYDG
ncbi:MAG: hypothetical protein CM1200mP4_0300 [Rhodospirillaceae bacterium]|nr:MAG: hypothetical protein CM1200mP4_0300 [Rhodospirillaceae bacterium]